MIQLFLMIAVVGFIVWLITTYIPMPPPFKTGIVVLSVIIVLLYVLYALGFSDVPIRPLR